jgi:hypothetical protein
MKPLQVRETLLEKGVRTFTPHDFEHIFRISPSRTKYFLETQTDEGLLTRLKQGIYALKTDIPSEQEIANSLYKPSYISLEYALAYWGIMPEMPYAVTSVTTKPTRLFTPEYGGVFEYTSIKRSAYTGYILVKPAEVKSGQSNFIETNTNGATPKSFLIAEPEKALVDYLYFVALGRKLENDRLFIKKGSLEKKKLRQYAKLYNKKKLDALVKAYL